MIPFSEQMQRWGRITDRPLNKFEQMMVARPIRYCVYWQTWSRVIKPVYEGHPLGFIELNLSPVPNAYDESYETRVNPMIMRSHGTPMDKKDLFATELPKAFMDALVNAVGMEQAKFMLEGDLWPLIDLNKFAEANRANTRGGGIPFASFRLKGTEGMPS